MVENDPKTNLGNLWNWLRLLFSGRLSVEWVPNLVPLLQHWRGVGRAQNDADHVRGRNVVLVIQLVVDRQGIWSWIWIVVKTKILYFLPVYHL